jgi:hypothetical protein
VVSSKRHKADWSRRLPRPLDIPRVMAIETLADVQKLIRHLPRDHRVKSTWQHVVAELNKAAYGADLADVDIALRTVLMLEHIKYRQR